MSTASHNSKCLAGISAVANGWGIQGVTVAQSGQPFSVIDFSGTAASIFFSADDFITNPILPLLPESPLRQATQGGTDNSFIPVDCGSACSLH